MPLGSYFGAVLRNFIQRLKIFSTEQNIATISKAIDNNGREALIELSGSTFECEAAAKGRLGGLIGGALAFPQASAAVPEGSGAGCGSGADKLK